MVRHQEQAGCDMMDVGSARPPLRGLNIEPLKARARPMFNRFSAAVREWFAIRNKLAAI
jgi:hypothetical protein